MASPDATPYVDLTLYDKDPVEVLESGLVNLLSYLPEWEPRRGQTELLLMESLALEVAEAIFAINRVPGAVVEVLLRLYGVERDLGAPPSATFTFTAVDTNGYTIPAGVRIALPLSSGSDPVVFTTDEAVVIVEGSLTATAPATGDRSTSEANGTIPGSAVELLDAVVSVDRVDLSSYVAGGADVELDEDWFTRGAQRFSRLAETLVLPRHFVAAALERPEVSRASAVDNYDPGQAGAPGTHAGHVTVAVYGDGAELSADQQALIEAQFDQQAQANLAVHVTSPTVTDVAVTATVVGVLGYSVAQVEANCVTALTDYLSPETWPWSGTVYRNEIIALLDRVEGVERVVEVSLGGGTGDVSLGGVAPLARLGSAAVTVTGL